MLTDGNIKYRMSKNIHAMHRNKHTVKLKKVFRCGLYLYIRLAKMVTGKPVYWFPTGYRLPRFNSPLAAFL